MPAKRKRGGRVTPKGTRAANTTKPTPKAEPSTEVPGRRGPVPRRLLVEKGRGARPQTHHRGNR